MTFLCEAQTPRALEFAACSTAVGRPFGEPSKKREVARARTGTDGAHDRPVIVDRSALCTIVLSVTAVATAAAADEPVPDDPPPAPTPPRWWERVEFHTYVDVYYALNANRPTTGESFTPGTGTTAKRANEFSLNLAAIDLRAQARARRLPPHPERRLRHRCRPRGRAPRARASVPTSGASCSRRDLVKELGMEVLEVRPKLRRDPDGKRLSEFLNAHLAWERAVARRRELVAVLALLGVPIFLCTALHLPDTLLGAALVLYGVTGAVVVLAWMNERALRAAVRETEQHVEVKRIDPDGPGGSNG